MSTAGGGSGVPEAQSSSSAPIRLGILDGNDTHRDALVAWVAQNAPDFEVAVSASNWLDLVLSSAFPTELVLLDYEVKEPVSLEARVRTCRAAGAVVVVLADEDVPAARQRSLDAGAAAFASKEEPAYGLFDAARRVLGRGASGARSSRSSHPRPRLSAGEEQALRLYAQGYSTNEVGLQMNVQYETAKTYLRRVRAKYAKVGRPASKKADLIRRAQEDGLLD